MSFEEGLAAASRDEGFKATVYAINTLLIRKGVYTQEEFQTFFVEGRKGIAAEATGRRDFTFGVTP